MNNAILGSFLILLAGFLQGSFAIFFRFTKPLKWEFYWSIYAVVALVLEPVIFALFTVPHLWEAILSLMTLDLLLPITFGALWGIGGLLFGKSLEKIGIALTYTIVLGMTTVIGTILPLIINHIALSYVAMISLIIGLFIMLIGVGVSGYAGKKKEHNDNQRTSIGIGLMLAVISGLFSPMLNIGFITGNTIASTAVRFGASPVTATSLVWVIVLFSGFVVNILYTSYLFGKDNLTAMLKMVRFKHFFAAALAGLCWFGGFALYGFGPSMLGNFGTSFGWAMLISFSIVISNVWGIVFGEWKGKKQAFRLQLSAITLILIGIIIVGVGMTK